MNNLQNLILNMHLNSYLSTERLLGIIKDLNIINTTKNKRYGCFTTEILENIDAFTMQELALSFKESINMPSAKYPYPFIRVSFEWGVIMLLQQNNLN